MFKIQEYLSILCRSIILLLLASPIAFAVGLGKLQVNSRLGEALNLELDVIAVSAAEISTLSVGLASRSDFARADVPYPENAALLNFNVVEGHGGRYLATITSDNPLNDTFLHLLISADWSGGKVVREYTALLDPPLYSGGAAVAVDLPGRTGESEHTYSDEILTVADAVTPITEPVTAAGSTSSATAGAGTLLVQRGDTLSGIVISLDIPGSVSMYQGLTAILEANPHAFIHGNMNRLMAGASLHIPSFASMAQIDRRVALQNFRNQVAEYSQYVAGIGRPVSNADSAEDTGEFIPQSAALPAAAIKPEEDADVGSAANLVIAEADGAEAGSGKVKVSPETPQEGGMGLSIRQETSDEEFASALSGREGDVARRGALNTRLAELEEGLLASGAENEAAKQRLQEMQNQVDRVSSLLEIEDANLAISQDRAASDDGADDDTAVIDETGRVNDSSETAIVEAGTTSETTDNAETAGDAALVGIPVTASTDESDAQAVAGTAQAGTKEKVQEQISQAWSATQTRVMDTFTGLMGPFSDYVLKIVAVLVAVLAALIFYRRRKSARESQGEFEKNRLDIESGQMAADTESGSFESLNSGSDMDLVGRDSGVELTIGGSMSYLTGSGISGVAEEENEIIQDGRIDPMAEAEVYLAYDRDEQAVQVLKEAYAAVPERSELAEKLLEIYHRQDDRMAFDRLASDLYSRIGASQGPVWAKIVAMGKEVSPDNDLYRKMSELPDSPPGLDWEQGREPAAPMADISLATDIAGPGLDDGELDLGRSYPANTAVKTPVDEHGLTFQSQQESAQDDQQPFDVPIEEIGDSELEFYLDGDSEGNSLDSEGISELVSALAGIDTQDTQPPEAEDDAVESVQVQAVEQAPDQDAHPGEAGPAEADARSVQESETAFELARAYLELGEKDIAKGFIEEVINQGNDKQRAKAEKLIKELAG